MLDKTLEWLLNIITNPLFAIGLLLVFIASYLKDEESVKSKAAKPPKFFKNELRPLPKWAYLMMIVAGLFVAIMGVLQVGGILQTNTTVLTSVEQVSLVSASYMAEDWDPRRIDLHRSEKDGIPVVAGESLEFFDLWVSSSTNSGSSVMAEILVDGKSIGITTEHIVASGQPVNLGDIQITNYEHAKVKGAWQVQSEWKEISIVLNQMVNGQPVKVNETKIGINPDGNAWFVEPPNAVLVLVAYRVNDGPELIMDLSNIMQNGIAVKEGDTLTLTQAWYKSNLRDDSKNIHLEAYLGSGSYDPASLIISPYIAINKGVNSLGALGNLSWTIPAEEKNLVMTLARNDRTVLDRYTIPLKSESSSGLVPLTSVVQWPFPEVVYLDFEQEDNLMGWMPAENTALGIRSEYAFSGVHALAVGTNSGKSQMFAYLPGSFQANLIVGQVYWPKAANISVAWAQVCIGVPVRCVSISQQPGQWNSFVVDLQQMLDDEGVPYSEKEITSFYFQGELPGVSQENQYLFYIDGIQIYPVKNP